MSETAATVAAPAAPRGVYLADWEENGYHDSYFHLLYWSFEKNEPVRVCYGATAYAGTSDIEGVIGWPECCSGAAFSSEKKRPEIPAEAREWLRKVYLNSLGDREAARILNPAGAIPKGTRVVFKRKVNKRKEAPVPEGAEGVVIWSGVDAWSVPRFKDSYKRTTYRAGVRLDGDGRTVFVPNSALRLDEEPAPLADLEAKAAEFAANATGNAFYSLYRTSAISML